MNWLQSLIYGLVSGFAEFLPISSQAHQRLLLHLFGIDRADPVRDLLVHIALLFALYSGCRTLFDQVRRDRRIQQNRHRGNLRLSRVSLDMKLVKTAVLPLIIGMVILSYLTNGNVNLVAISAFLLVNGIILYIPDRMLQANKDVRSMSAFDSYLIGICGALSVLPGISRIGSMSSSAVARGADKQHTLNWVFLLSVPALIVLIGLDLLGIISSAGDISFWSSFFTYVLSTAAAYIGGYLSIVALRFIMANVGISGFCYYSWGAALFTFIIYLTAV